MRLHDVLLLHRLLNDQWRRPEVLQRIQARRLQALVRHAYAAVPFYREQFDRAGVTPGEIRTAADLVRLPIVTRREIQALPQGAILARGVDPDACVQLTTSGSSGMPLKVFEDREDRAAYDMVWTRTALTNGQRPWDTVAAFKFNRRPVRWFQRLGIWRKGVVSLEANLEDQVEALRRLQAPILRGSPYQLVDAARAVQRRGIRDVRPRMIFCQGALLEAPDRNLITSVFHAPVFDFYGSTELGCVAWECPVHEGYHINTDTVIVEFIKDGRPAEPGEMGRIVCTSLFARTMPFIRYDTGDVGEAGRQPCTCGRGLPMMTRIQGRADDFFVRADGGVISPSLILNRVKWTPGLLRIRLTQHAVTHIAVDVVAEPGHEADACQSVTATLRKMLDDDTILDVQSVAAIAPDPSGKIRSMICMLDRSVA